MMRWEDAKQVAQLDVNRLLQKAQTPPSSRDGASNADILEAEAGPLVKAVALVLRRIFHEGRPRGLTRNKIMLRVCKEAGERDRLVLAVYAGSCAVALAWPRPKRSRVPKAAKQPR